MRFADGRLMKHPRAANFAWRAENGKYLYWFHNHGGRFIREHPRQRSNAYEERNPVWLSGGVEADGPTGKIIRWSQPEIVLYDDDPIIRMSYPDLVEDGGKYYLTETQKDVARVHEIDPVLLAGLWGAAERPVPGKVGDVTFYQRSKRADHGKEDLRAGFSLDLWVNLASLDPGQTLLSGAGLALRTIAGGAVELTLTDGRSESRWASDPGSIAAGKPQHIVVIVDGGPKIISFVTNGQFNDGGEHRQYGWGRFSPHLKNVMGLGELKKSPAVLKLNVFNRYLRTAEAIASYLSGPR